jgi:hypothetical protein
VAVKKLSSAFTWFKHFHQSVLPFLWFPSSWETRQIAVFWSVILVLNGSSVGSVKPYAIFNNFAFFFCWCLRKHRL